MKEKIIKEEMFNHLTLDSNQKKQIKAVFAKPENESVDFSEREHPSSSTEEILPNNFFCDLSCNRPISISIENINCQEEDEKRCFNKRPCNQQIINDQNKKKIFVKKKKNQKIK